MSEETLELASAPLRARQVGLSSTGVMALSSAVPSLGSEERRSRTQRLGVGSSESEENALSGEVLPFAVCSRVVFGKQESAGGVWLAHALPGCGWGRRTGPNGDTRSRIAVKGRRRCGDRGDAGGRAKGSEWSSLSVTGVPVQRIRLSSRRPVELV